MLVYLVGAGQPLGKSFSPLEAYFSAWEPGYQDPDLLFPDSKYNYVTADIAVGPGILDGAHSLQALEDEKGLVLYPWSSTARMAAPRSSSLPSRASRCDRSSSASASAPHRPW